MERQLSTLSAGGLVVVCPVSDLALQAQLVPPGWSADGGLKRRLDPAPWSESYTAVITRFIPPARL